MDARMIKSHAPLMLLGAGQSLDPEQAIDLIAAILRMVRSPSDGASDDPQSITAIDGVSMQDGTAKDSGRLVSRASNTAPVSRVAYSLKGVRDGQTLRLDRPTPGMVKVVDFLRKNPKATLREVMDETKLSRNTVANLFTSLRKQKLLNTENA